MSKSRSRSWSQTPKTAPALALAKKDGESTVPGFIFFPPEPVIFLLDPDLHPQRQCCGAGAGLFSWSRSR